MVLAAGAVAAAIFLWSGTTSVPETSTPTGPPSTPGSADPSPSEAVGRVESTRTVSVNRETITVEEASTVIGGEAARAVPATGMPLGLQLIDSSVISADGRSEPFDAPVTISASGTLTVRNSYRLTDCPDVIPTQWPSPADFPGASRSYVRLDEPLRTAYALCPESKSDAAQLPDLAGTVIEGNAPRVRLTWLGGQTLTIKAIGSASGVAALVPNPDCNASCVASIPSGAVTEIQLTPVDPCPPATEDNQLTLVVQIAGTTSIAAVEVKGLSEVICS